MSENISKIEEIGDFATHLDFTGKNGIFRVQKVALKRENHFAPQIGLTAQCLSGF